MQDEKLLMKRVQAATFSEAINNLSPILAIKAWKKCAGPALLKKVLFLGVYYKKGSRRVLKLGVRESVWLQELQYQKKSLCERFNQAVSEISLGKNDLKVHECEIVYYTKKTRREKESSL